MTDEDNAKKLVEMVSVMATENNSFYGKKWGDLTEQQQKNLTYFAKKVREELKNRE